MLNMLSIKKRLFILLCFPLILLLIIALAEIKQDVTTLNQLSLLEQRTELVKTLIRLNNAFHEQRLAVLYQDKAKFNSKILKDKLMDIKLAIPYAIQNKINQNTSIQLVNEMSNLGDEFYETERADIADWSVWFTNIIENLYFSLERDILKPADEHLNSNQQTLYQLQWLHFWANEERWNANLLSQLPSKEIKSRLFTINERQQIFFERIIATNVDPLQTSMFKNIFTDNSFMASYVLNNLIQGDDYLNKSQYNIAELDQRIELIKSVTIDISKQFSNRIANQISATKLKLALVLLSLVMGGGLFLLQGLAVTRRVSVHLNESIMQIRGVIKNNFSQKVKIEGNDEFTELAQVINEVSDINLTKQRYYAKQQSKQRDEIAAKREIFDRLAKELVSVSVLINCSKEDMLTLRNDEIYNLLQTPLDKLFSIHNALHAYTSYDSVDNKVVTAKCDLRELTFSVLKALQPLVYQRDKKLVVNISDDLPEQLLLDEGKVKQILLSVYTSIINSSFGGEIKIIIETMPLPNSRSDLHISIEDNNGESADINETILYSSYLQQLTDQKDKQSGTNTGLITSATYIENMGGQLSIDLSTNCNPIFYFGLQVLRVEDVNNIQTDISTDLYLVTNEVEFSDNIISELTRLEFANINIVEYASELEQQLTVNGVILYCQKNTNLTNKDYTRLKKFKSDMKMLLCREYAPEPEALDDRVSAIITVPILGDSLLHALQYNIESELGSDSKQA